MVYLKIRGQSFTARQYMIHPDFEIFHCTDEQLKEIEYHNHDFYEVYLFISGNISYIIEGKNYKLRPGDIILVSHNEIHKVDIESGVPYERVVIWINPEYIKKNNMEETNLLTCFESSSRQKHHLLRPNEEMLDQIWGIMQKLEKACCTSGYGNNILKNIYLCEFIVHLNKAYLDTKNDEIEVKYNRRVNEIIKYINNNLEADLSLEFLAAKFYLSKFHLLREFKKHTGYTLHQFILQKRLIMAKSLLKECDQITEICLRCGFGDYSNFIRCFRKAFGLPPKKMQMNQGDGSGGQVLAKAETERDISSL